MHHGYSPKGGKPKSNQQAQIDMIEEVLSWAGVSDVKSVSQRRALQCCHASDMHCVPYVPYVPYVHLTCTVCPADCHYPCAQPPQQHQHQQQQHRGTAATAGPTTP